MEEREGEGEDEECLRFPGTSCTSCDECSGLTHGLRQTSPPGLQCALRCDGAVANAGGKTKSCREKKKKKNQESKQQAIKSQYQGVEKSCSSSKFIRRRGIRAKACSCLLD